MRDYRPVRTHFNLHLHGRWYGSFNPPGSTDPQMEGRDFSVIRHARRERSTTGWDPIDAPVFPDKTFAHAYTIDLDADQLTRYERGREPPIDRFPLSAVHDEDDLQKPWAFNHQTVPVDIYNQKVEQPPVPETLRIRFNPPTWQHQLQYEIATDFIYQWREMIDDPSTWLYPSDGFKQLAIALLRIAAWELEVEPRTPGPDEACFESQLLSITRPHWDYPSQSVFWFHGVVIVFCLRLDRTEPVEEAIRQAQEFLGVDRQGTSHVILTSLRHVAFMKISQGSVSCSAVFPLITNTSAQKPSPGLRALVHVLSPFTWKKPLSLSGERWGFHLPLEIIEMILHHLGQRELALFRQASSIVDRCYYSMIPKPAPDFPGLHFPKHEFICPVCFEGSYDLDIVCCVSCLEWHPNCTWHEIASDEYRCILCKRNGSHPTLAPGRIQQRSSQPRAMPDSNITINGRHLKLCPLRKPLPEGVSYPVISMIEQPIQYKIQFSGVFSGVAYRFANIGPRSKYRHGRWANRI
ncbi:hypothetical protein AWENTII_011826 [Aspergillus wentii]